MQVGVVYKCVRDDLKLHVVQRNRLHIEHLNKTLLAHDASGDGDGSFLANPISLSSVTRADIEAENRCVLRQNAVQVMCTPRRYAVHRQVDHDE
jgi:hypothetical protein